MLNVRRTLLLSSLLALLSAPALADTVHLTLVSDRQGEIEGDSTQFSLGRENTIECTLFRYSMRATSTSIVAGTLTCRKRLDKATPMLLRALISRDLLTMTARFYRPNPTGDGTTEQHYTIQGSLGRLVGIKEVTPDQTQGASVDFEEITFEFNSLLFTWNNGGVEAAWSAPR